MITCWIVIFRCERPLYYVPRVNKIASVKYVSMPTFRWLEDRYFYLNQELSNKLWAKSNHTHSYTIYDCFHTTVAEFSICDRPNGPQSKKCVLSGPLQKMSASPWYKPYKGWYCFKKLFWKLSQWLTHSLTHSLSRAKKLKCFLASCHLYSEISRIWNVRISRNNKIVQFNPLILEMRIHS